MTAASPMKSSVLLSFLLISIVFVYVQSEKGEGHEAELLDKVETLVRQGRGEDALKLLEGKDQAPFLLQRGKESCSWSDREISFDLSVRLLFEMDEISESERLANEAITKGLADKEPLFFYYRAMCVATRVPREDLESLKAAHADLDRALIVLPNHIGSLVQKAEVTRNIVFNLRKTQQEDDNYPDILVGEADTLVNKALKLTPKSADDFFQKSLAYVMDGDFDNALTLLDRSVKRNQIRGQLFFVRGGARIQMGDYQGGVSDCEKAQQLLKSDNKWAKMAADLIQDVNTMNDVKQEL